LLTKISFSLNKNFWKVIQTIVVLVTLLNGRNVRIQL